MHAILFCCAVLLALVACGCRCRSELEAQPGTEAISPQATVSTERPPLWCRACAKRAYLACKRVDGSGPEEELRRQAELAACKDVGYTPEECTADKIYFAECGKNP